MEIQEDSGGKTGKSPIVQQQRHQLKRHERIDRYTRQAQDQKAINSQYCINHRKTLRFYSATFPTRQVSDPEIRTFRQMPA